MFTDDIFVCAFKSYISNTDDIIFIKDKNLVYRAASRAFAMLTQKSGPSAVVGLTDYELFGDRALSEQYRNDDKRILLSGKSETYIEPLPPVDGIERWSSTTKTPLFDSQNNTVGIMAIGRDISFKMHAFERYNSEIKYFTTLKANTICSAIFDISLWELTMHTTNPDFAERALVFGDAAGYINESIKSFTNLADAEEFKHFFTPKSLKSLYYDGHRSISYESLRLSLGGADCWQRDEYRLLVNPADDHLIVAIAAINIENEKHEKNLLVHAAEHDSMTGLLNHSFTQKYIFEFLNNPALPPDSIHALFFIDIDNFKAVNDTFGHISGDSIILKISEIIKGLFRSTDIIGRFGGDEFVVMFKNVQRTSQISDRARSLIDGICFKYTSNESYIDISASIGIAVWRPGCGYNYTELLAQADSALYKAKQSGKNCFAFYDDIAPAIKSEILD